MTCTELGGGVHVEAAVLVDEAVDWERVESASEVVGVLQVHGSVTARDTPAPVLALRVRAGPTPAAPQDDSQEEEEEEEERALLVSEVVLLDIEVAVVVLLTNSDHHHVLSRAHHHRNHRRHPVLTLVKLDLWSWRKL